MKKKPSLGVLSLVLLLVLSILPAALMGTWLVNSTRAELENTVRQTVGFYVNQFSSRTETILKSLQGNIFILTTDDEIRTAMRGGAGGLTGAEQNAGRIITGAGWIQNSVTGIFIFRDEDNFIPVLRGGIYSSASRRAKAVYGEFYHHNSARSLLYTQSCPGYCYLVVNYLDTQTMTPLGKIIIELDAAALLEDQYLTQAYTGAQAMLFGTGAGGETLHGDAASPLAQAAAADSLSSDDFIQVEGKSFYHLSRQLGHYNLRIDVFVPEDEIFAGIQTTTRLYLLVIAGVLVLTMALVLIVYALLTRPLRHMVGAIHAVSAGDLTVQMPPTPYRETEVISTAFNSMTEHLQELFDEVYQSGLYLRDAEYKLLEAQINPHFIFNVLEVINLRAAAAHQPDICRMVTQLAHLLRSNLSHRDQPKLSFGQELEYVDFYLQLQKQRFEENLRYSIHLEDESIRRLYLPKLTIQPVVENSVVHGLENKRGGGAISLRIWEEEDSVWVRVEDDGVGFDPTDAALDGPPPTEGPHNHLALYNIHRRIQLLYGEGYGLSIESAPGAGSRVTIVLPIDHNTEKKDEHAENTDS